MSLCGHPTPRQLQGSRSERLAAAFLRSRGYTIAETNVRFAAGEIDIVARQGEVLCFVEVRCVSSDYAGGPLATVNRRKQQRIIRAARCYLNRLRQWPAEMRFDVVGITWPENAPPAIELIPGAFDAS